MTYTLDTSFEGGNAFFDEITETEVKFSAELRDTVGDWFFWAFRVRGAGGKTIKFTCSKQWVGRFGAAVSHDYKTWEWSNSAVDGSSFVYTFAENENEVWFAHNMLYRPERFTELCAELGLEPSVLCRDRSGENVPCLEFGDIDADKTVVFTSRHHACEATGDYILEGIIRRFSERPLDGYRLFAVPFIDFDGVVNGDQGKNRFPHDHNRDYIEEIYPTVAAVKQYLHSHSVKAVCDLHSPWHQGGMNDHLYIVRNSETSNESFERLSDCLEKSVNANTLQYHRENDMPANQGWNTNMASSCSDSSAAIKGVRIGLSLETPYFGLPNDKVSRQKLIETGKAFAEALRLFLAE